MHAAIRPQGQGLWSHLRQTQLDEALAPLRALLAAGDFTTPYRFLEAILTGPMRGRQALLARLGPEAGDAIDELLNAAIAFEKEDNPSLQHFIDWFDRGEGEIKRDLGESSNAVRVMTVHGAKGLQAPIVILADASFNPDKQQRGQSVDWDCGDDLMLPILMPRKAERFGTVEKSVDDWKQRETQEHWRLLYVAMTRAEEVLAIGGALPPRAKGVAPEGSWHSQVARALGTLGAAAEPDPIWGAQHVWLGRHRDKPAQGKAEDRKAPAEILIPQWLHAPAPQESRPPRPLAPSAAIEDELAYAPPSAQQREAAARGIALHALFELLPAVAPEQRRAAAGRWLQRQAGMGDADGRDAIISQALGLIEDPRFATLFGEGSLAEAPIAATVEGLVITGTIDRMVIEDDRVLVVDFKTGLRVPDDAATLPRSHVRQMAAYAAALAVIFPGRRIEAGILYTAAPQLFMIDPAVLAANKPGLDRSKDNLSAPY